MVNTYTINSRVFSNAFNGNNLDLTILAEEDSKSVSIVNHGVLKAVILDTVNKLSPIKFARFAIGFYGSSESLRWPVNMWDNSSASISTNVQNLRYSGTGSSSDSLPGALATVYGKWSNTTRPNVPNVLVIIGTYFNTSMQQQIRRLENELSVTVIIVGIGAKVTQTILEQLASRPYSSFALQFQTFNELSSLPYALPTIISDVPRPVAQNSVSNITGAQIGSPNILMIPLTATTAANETMVAVQVECENCTVYGSVKDLIPLSTNANSEPIAHSSPSIPKAAFYYFRVSKAASRLFVNIEANKNNIPISARYYYFPVPKVLV